jgi:hypothetical protein
LEGRLIKRETFFGVGLSGLENIFWTREITGRVLRFGVRRE